MTHLRWILMSFCLAVTLPVSANETVDRIQDSARQTTEQVREAAANVASRTNEAARDGIERSREVGKNAGETGGELWQRVKKATANAAESVRQLASDEPCQGTDKACN